MQVHALCFEGPDGYAQAGGISSRITGLTRALAGAGFETHLWFVGEPTLAGHETQGNLHLHRWCQWISRYHPAGVYDGEDGKRDDYAASLPPFLMRQVLLPHLRRGGQSVILAEEWHTVDAVLHLEGLLRRAGVRHQVTIFWNANNTFSFERIAWNRLAEAAVITTVSRYMKHLMWGFGIDPLVMPNGLADDALIPPDPRAVKTFLGRLRERTVLSKVARWDPDKRWLLAIRTVRLLKDQGWKPLLVARGGLEAHGAEVWAEATASGLQVAERVSPQPGVRGLLRVLEDVREADIINLRSPLDAESRRVLFQGSAAVLANSGREPFGLVGLETMAAGGVACTGCTGEDYVVPGQNALVLETTDPWEFVSLFGELRANPAQELAIRLAGLATAEQFTWQGIVQRLLLPRLHFLANTRRSPGSDGTERLLSRSWIPAVQMALATGIGLRYDTLMPDKYIPVPPVTQSQSRS